MTAADQGEGSVPRIMEQTKLPWSVQDAGPWHTGPAAVTPRSDPAQQCAAAGGTQAGAGPAAAPGRCPQAQGEVPEQLTGRVRIWYLRAAEHHDTGRPDRAAELLVSAVRVEPSLGCLREALARAQYDAGQYLAARTTFTAMTALDPVDHYALFGLGLAETRLGAHAAAVRHLERAVHLHTGDPRYAIALEQARAALRWPERTDPAGGGRFGCPGDGTGEGASERSGDADTGQAGAAGASGEAAGGPRSW